MVYGRSHERKDIVHGLPGQRFPFPCSGFGLACALFGLRIPGRCLQKLSFEGGKKIGRQFDHRQGVNFILEMRLILTIVLADGLSFSFAPCKIGVHQVSDGDFFPFDGVDAGDGNLRKEFCAFFLNQSRTDALTVSADSFPVAFALGVRETKTVDTIRLTGSRVTFGGLAVENALKLGLYVFSAGYVAHEEIITTNYSNWKMIIHSLSKMYFPENFSNDNTFDLLIILAIILATCEGQRESSSDPWMAVRILAYTALLWQDLIKSGAVREGEALPPVFPMVIYNGRTPWTAARDVVELLAPVSGPLERYQPRQHYFLLDESQVSEELLHSGGLVAQLVRLERAREPEEVRQVVKELTARLHGPEYARLRRAFTVWLGRVVLKRSGITEDISELHDLREVDAMLEERAAQWKDDYIRQGVLMGLAEGRMEGLAEGEARGRVEGKAEGFGLALQDFLETRFGHLPPSVISSIAAFSDADTLRGLTLSAYRAESLEAFLEQLKKSASHLR